MNFRNISIVNNKIRKSIRLFCCLMLTTNTYAQYETGTWYFGQNTGLDFMKGKVVVLKFSRLNTSEGCAIISDRKGNLIMYTDGIQVWNKKHEPMYNGSGLFGHPSSTQSAIIVPWPDHQDIFYVFTLDSEANPHGFCYSLVDISKFNGLGEITEKNHPVDKTCTEKVAAVGHANKTDIWVIVHEYNSNRFKSYLLTAKGLNQNAVISECGFSYQGTIYNSIGYLKISSDKKHLATAINGEQLVQIFDFNNNTGEITNPISIKIPENNTPYGVEFSPNNKYLYVSTVKRGIIYQINLAEKTPESIQRSLIQVGQSPTLKNSGALQLGLDGKIYIAEYQSKHLSTIEFPDENGIGCTYSPFSVNLKYGMSSFGLPTFFQDYVHVFNRRIIYFDSKKLKTNIPYILKNVYFDFNQTTLQDSSCIELNKLSAALKANQKLHIYITGHTDSLGTQEYNTRLSHERAKSVGMYLIKSGIDKERVNFQGKGFDEPLCDNQTEENRQRNRRVEFIVEEKTNN